MAIFNPLFYCICICYKIKQTPSSKIIDYFTCYKLQVIPILCCSAIYLSSTNYVLKFKLENSFQLVNFDTRISICRLNLKKHIFFPVQFLRISYFPIKKEKESRKYQYRNREWRQSKGIYTWACSIQTLQRHNREYFGGDKGDI